MLAYLDTLRSGLVPVKVTHIYRDGSFGYTVTASRYAYPKGLRDSAPAHVLIARDGVRRSKFGTTIRAYGTLASRPVTL